jgi:predicted GNAT family acetyltransferase
MAGVEPLDNPVWHALSGPHAPFAEGQGRARRYRREVNIFGACDVLDSDGWRALVDLVGPGGVAVLFRTDIGAPPQSWKTVYESTAHQMVLDAKVTLPPTVHGIVALDGDDVAAMLALTQLTEPGPFFERTIELGAFAGVHDDGRLVAMAGERFRFDGHCEISGVCTHPDARRRGLAAALTVHIANGIRGRGDVPFLHVVSTNTAALAVYQQLGFRTRAIVEVKAFVAPG